MGAAGGEARELTPDLNHSSRRTVMAIFRAGRALVRALYGPQLETVKQDGLRPPAS